MRFSVLSLLIWLISYQATACSFANGGAPHSFWYDNSKSVFLARVASIKISDFLGKIMGARGLSFRAKIEIIEMYKGLPPENYEVTGDQDAGGNCGITMVEGQYYLIFISKDDSGDNHVGYDAHTLSFSNDLESPVVKEILGEMRSLRDKQRH